MSETSRDLFGWFGFEHYIAAKDYFAKLYRTLFDIGKKPQSLLKLHVQSGYGALALYGTTITKRDYAGLI